MNSEDGDDDQGNRQEPISWRWNSMHTQNREETNNELSEEPLDHLGDTNMAEGTPAARKRLAMDPVPISENLAMVPVMKDAGDVQPPDQVETYVNTTSGQLGTPQKNLNKKLKANNGDALDTMEKEKGLEESDSGEKLGDEGTEEGTQTTVKSAGSLEEYRRVQ